MKCEWKQKQIGDLCQVIAGQSPEGKFYNSEGKGVPFYQGKRDFGEKFIEEPTTWTTDTTKIAQQGDILMSVRAPVGPINFATNKICIGRGLAAIRSGPELNRDFLFYQLWSLQPKIAGSAGAVFASINKSDIEQIGLSIPPLPEQKRIVCILEKTFAAIDLAKANAEKNLQNARALFESHLQADFTPDGDGWAKKRLSEVSIEFGRGKSKHRPRNDPKLYGGEYPFIQTGDIRNSTHLITSYTQTYNDVGLAQSKLWPAGTVCITIAANIAETGILTFDACFPDSVIGVVTNDSIASNKFLEYQLRSLKARLQAQGKGSAQDNINMGTFENQFFSFPSLNVQRKIASTLDALREETQRLESIYQQKLAALGALKKSLLHQAFSGQL